MCNTCTECKCDLWLCKDFEGKYFKVKACTEEQANEIAERHLATVMWKVVTNEGTNN